MAHHISSPAVERLKDSIIERFVRGAEALRLEHDEENIRSLAREAVAYLSPDEDLLHEVVVESGVSHVLSMDDWSHIEFCIFAELNELQEYLESPQGQGTRFNGLRRIVVASHPDTGLRLHNIELAG